MNSDCLDRDYQKLELIKQKVHRLHGLMKKRMPDIKLSESYNIYSKAAGYKNWQVMSAIIKKHISETYASTDNMRIASNTCGCEDVSIKRLYSLLKQRIPNITHNECYDIYSAVEVMKREIR